MKKLQMNNEHRILIESVIKELPLYRGNEDLSLLFCETIYKKSYLLIDAIKDQVRLKRHLIPICETCMAQIIKESQKFASRREPKKEPQIQIAKEEIVSLRSEKKQIEKPKVVSLKEEFEIPQNDISEALIDPIDYCPKKEASEETVEKLIQIVKLIDNKHPQKRYYEIFFLRYLKGLNQAEIAQSMNISQAEISKRFIELIKLTTEKI